MYIYIELWRLSKSCLFLQKKKHFLKMLYLEKYWADRAHNLQFCLAKYPIEMVMYGLDRPPVSRDIDQLWCFRHFCSGIIEHG